MKADKVGNDWKLYKEILNTSNRNKLWLKLAIWLFVMSFVSTMTVLFFSGEFHWNDFHRLGMVRIFALISGTSIFSAIYCRRKEITLRRKFKKFICKLRSKCQKSMSDKAAFQCEVYLKEIESILNAYNRRGFLDQDMQWCKLEKYFFKIQCTIIKSGVKIESIMNPRELKEWSKTTTKYNELMETKWFFRNMATIIHEYFCHKRGIAKREE